MAEADLSWVFLEGGGSWVGATRHNKPPTIAAAKHPTPKPHHQPQSQYITPPSTHLLLVLLPVHIKVAARRHVEGRPRQVK